MRHGNEGVSIHLTRLVRAMKLLYFNGQLLKKGGRVRLVYCADNWLVLGDGYVSQVRSREEGLNVIDGLIAAAKKRGVTIESSRPAS